MVFSPLNRKRVLTLAIFVSFCFAATNSPSVDAYKGPGYFQGGTACTTDYDWASKCNVTFASTSQNNVVYGGSGVNALAGVSSGNKASFITWLTNRYNNSPVVNRGNSVPDTATVQNRLGAQFIIATMLGSPGQRNNLAEVVTRVNNPNISMTTMNGIPESYGPISFSGKNSSTGARDEFFNTDGYSPGVSKLLLVFRNTSTGSIVYILEYPCANPLGGLPGLPSVPPPPPPAPSWAMSGRTEATSAGVAVTTVTRGQSVTFRHYVKNDGPDTSTSISASTIVSGGVGTAKASHNVGTFTSGQEKNTDTDTFTVPLTAAVGAMYCQYPRYEPRSNSAAGYENGTNACVTVVRSYTLTPHVTTPITTVKQGDSVVFSYSVDNPGAGTATNATTHVPRAIIIPPAVSPPAGFFTQKDSIAGCPTYTALAPGVTCVNVAALSGSRVYPQAVSTTSEGSETVLMNYPVGTQVCRTFSVYPRDASGNVARNRDSVLSCVLVAASPYLTIVGGSLWSGGSITAPYTGVAKVTASAPSSFGSFGDYGVFSTGEINYFGSAGQTGKDSSTSGMTSGTWLTFANEDPASLPNLGSYSSTHKITDISAVPAGAVLVSGSMTVPGTGVYRTTSDITITASNMAPGSHVSIYAPNNTVTIDGNITYNTSGVSSFAQLPSLTIAARRIQISGTVTEVAGNFYASSSFVTCYQGPASPAENAAKSAAITSVAAAACNHRLDIHGAVTVANQAVNSLVLNRSYGGAKDGEPAEVIRMRPEVFLTAYDLSAKSASVTVTTVQETELPPRY